MARRRRKRPAAPAARASDAPLRAARSRAARRALRAARARRLCAVVARPVRLRRPPLRRDQSLRPRPQPRQRARGARSALARHRLRRELRARAPAAARRRVAALRRDDDRVPRRQRAPARARVGAARGGLRRARGCSRVASVGAALLFLVHPANVEAVAWISQAKTPPRSRSSMGALLAHRRRPALGALLFGAGAARQAGGGLRAARRGPPRLDARGPRALALARALGRPARRLLRRGVLDPSAQRSRQPIDPDWSVRLRTSVAIAARYVVDCGDVARCLAFHEPEPVRSWLDPRLARGRGAGERGRRARRRGAAAQEPRGGVLGVGGRIVPADLAALPVPPPDGGPLPLLHPARLDGRACSSRVASRDACRRTRRRRRRGCRGR